MAITGIVGSKMGMASIYDEQRRIIPVTLVDVSGCVVTQIKTDEDCGYNAVQVGHDRVPERKLNRPQLGHLKPSGALVRGLAEFRVDEIGDIGVGQPVNSEGFSVGDRLKVTGITKGRGFSGGMRRHGFSGAQKTHGQSDRARAPGSIGSGTYPGRVIPGMKMAGRYGGARCTTRGLKLVRIDAEKNILFIKGAVPGPNHGKLIIQKQVTGR